MEFHESLETGFPANRIVMSAEKNGRSAFTCKERQARADHPDRWSKTTYSSISEEVDLAADESIVSRSICRQRCLFSRGPEKDHACWLQSAEKAYRLVDTADGEYSGAYGFSMHWKGNRNT